MILETQTSTSRSRFESIELKHFVNGTWVGGGGDERCLVNPATGETAGKMPVASPVIVASAVRAATTAFEGWSSLTPRERGEYLLELADRIEAAGSDLATLESWDVGRPISDVVEDIAPLVDVLRFFAGAARLLQTQAAGQYEPGTTSIVLAEPVGVVGLITPWNYPLVEALWKIAPALAAGNTAVVKPSEITPFSTVALAQLAMEVFPPGVLNVVLGDASTGGAIVEHPGIAMVSLTGDTATGRKIAANGAKTLKRVQLELGGKAPVLVFNDANIAEAAEQLAVAGFTNAGQNCTAASRIIVQQESYGQFVEAYVEAVKALKVGDPFDPATQVGPLVSEAQMDRVLGFLDRARATGVCFQTGGKRVDRPGFFIEPTIVTGADQSSELVQQEIFGPVVTIQRATNESEMLSWANDTAYGLSASLWTRDLSRAMELTRKLRFGTVWVNRHLSTVPEMPFGGFGQSGYGKEMSLGALEEYSQMKHVMISSSR